MPRFRKKPVVIEAVRYLPDNAIAIDAMLAHLEGCTDWHMSSDGIVIPTLEGDHLASVGDWIIRGVAGEYYPCKPDIFGCAVERAISLARGWELS